MSENIRLIYDVMQYCDNENIPGLIVQLDFEKAFDSVSWTFVYKILDLFNFKPSIKRWVYTFYNKPVSFVLQNGIASSPFYLERGCRQGDPLSPYIFILCAEILSLLVKNDPRVKGLEIGALTIQDFPMRR